MSLTKIPWVILLPLSVKTSEEARVIFTFVKWFHYSFLLVMIQFLEFVCHKRVFPHSKWREIRIGVLYEKQYM